MQVEQNIEPKNIEDEINLKEFFHVLIRGKWIIVSVTGFMSIIGVIYSLQLPNIYESRALLVSVDSSSNISGALKNYSGLAGLAGISLPSSSPDSNSAKAIKTMSSLSFFENNIMPNIVHICWGKGWEKYNNNDVLYLSRSDIPSNSRKQDTSMLKAYHIVPFRKKFLLQFTKLKKNNNLQLLQFLGVFLCR